ncbi:MAG TPA: hypothetical protein VFT10_06075, partial [Solirubrobacterales bacterium]|nr:hypothetical protein [Solirubrobacterales bacterium]
GAGVRGSIAAIGAVLLLSIGASAASAADIIAPQSDPPKSTDGWQAGTCTSDLPECSVDTKDQFYKLGAGHPPVGFTQFIIKKEAGPPLGETPVGNLKTVRVDLPVGLSVNPQATDQCELGPGQSPGTTCGPTTQVGTSAVTATNPDTGFSVAIPPVPVYNLVPLQGQPARFGLSILNNDIFLEAGIAWESDYHEHFTINVAKLELGGIPGLEAARVAKNRLVFNGRAGDGTFITTPSTCFDPEAPGFEQVYSTFLRADSYEEPDPIFPNGSPFIESPLPPGEKPEDCAGIPFDPSIGVEPGTAQTDSPAGALVNVDLPHILGGANRANSNLRTARVSLPQGMGLNPSAANGLQACSDEQLHKGSRDPVACPAASRIGTVAIDTPPLPDGSLTGNVYLGKQLNRDPASGQLYRIFVVAESARYGISVRLIGNVVADPQTGRLTAVFSDNPQVPFSSFRVQIDGGPRAPLTSPPTCGPNAATTLMAPWSGNPPAQPSASFTLTSAPGGGACAQTLAARPFALGFGAKTTNPKGGAHTHFEVEIARSDGNQELKGADVFLPPGLTAKLAGVRYCPESAIAEAAANSGAAEAASSSCPNSSLIGSAEVAAGTGPTPLQITGKAFLAGPYQGAPLSLVVITPATAGPFDLGSVVVRVALFVDPATAQIHAVSDAIPHVFGGATLDIRSVAVKVNRPKFSINPTNCDPKAVSGVLRGGGANPLDPAAFSALPVSVPFQVKGCDALGFKPKLFIRLFGGTRRAKIPKLRAVLLAREGDANIGRAAVTLPKALILEQGSLADICTRVQFAAHDCPKDSIYGHATAETPLLDGPLKGPVYLRSSDNELPDLVATLRGQVGIELAGRIDSVKGSGKIRTTFDVVPDVAVSKFVLTMRGGKKGLLINSRNLCARKYKAIARFKGQNGKKANMRPKLRAPCKKQRRGRGKQKSR